jgi:hypothetical protein
LGRHLRPLVEVSALALSFSPLLTTSAHELGTLPYIHVPTRRSSYRVKAPGPSSEAVFYLPQTFLASVASLIG